MLSHKVLGKEFMYIDFTSNKQELAPFLNIQKMRMKSADFMPIITSEQQPSTTHNNPVHNPQQPNAQPTTTQCHDMRIGH